MSYFKNLNKVWQQSSAKTKYFGKVKIRLEGDESSELHMFANQASFVQEIELDFDKSLTAAKTLYFFKEAGGWMPVNVVQMDGSISTNGESIITYGNLVLQNSHNYKFELNGESTDKEKQMLDREFFRPFCMDEYTSEFKSRL